ncbi:MAG: nickel-responsive transcriptional regulator NikR [Candidatus Ranarchaeia archaeon]
MGTFNISLPIELINQINSLVKLRGYASRSEFIRDAIRTYISNLEWELRLGSDVFASITLIYSTHSDSTSLEVKKIQHDHNDIIITTVHSHMKNRCLEVIITKGDSNKIKHLVDHLNVVRGVENVQISVVKTN